MRKTGMMDTSAQVAEYREKARQSLREADANFLFGEYLAGAECMWVASAYAIKAVCHRRGWPYQNKSDLGNAVGRLSSELRDAGGGPTADVLNAGLVIASNYRINFYHRDMDLNGGDGRFFSAAKEAVEQFIVCMIAISESPDC